MSVDPTELLQLASCFTLVADGIVQFGPYRDKRTTSERTIEIQRQAQRDGSIRWAVVAGSACLNRDGQFEYQPLPSNRDDEFLQRCRWATLDEAFEAALATIADQLLDDYD